MEKKDNTMMIVAIAGGGCMLLLIIGLVVYFMFYNKEENTASSSTTNTPSNKSSPSSRSSPSPSPSPAPASMSINGQTFNPTGYTVGGGWIWNRYTIGGPTDGSWCDTPECKTITSSPEECRKKCVDNSSCVHFGRAVNDGRCYLFAATANSGQDAHVRGFKKDGDKEYTKAVNLVAYYDSAHPANKQEFTLQGCADKCTSDSNCHAFYYRTDQHTDPNLRKTCVLHGDGSWPDKFKEGAVGR